MRHLMLGLLLLGCTQTDTFLRDALVANLRERIKNEPTLCTPEKQRLFLVGCKAAVEHECAIGEACFDPLTCIDALKVVCPNPMCALDTVLP